MSAFAETDARYETASTATVYSVAVDPAEVGTVARAQTQLWRLVNAGDEDLTPVADILRFARYRLATNILAASDPVLGVDVLTGELLEQLEQLDPGTPAHAAATRARHALDTLLSRDTTNLRDEVIELLAMADEPERTLVLAQGHHVEATAELLTRLGVPTPVVAKSQLRSTDFGGTVVLVGPHQFFPPAVWNAARTDTVCFVHYPFGPITSPSGGLFGPDGGLKTPKFRTSGQLTPAEDIDVLDVNEELAAVSQREAARRYDSSGELAEAALVLLEGGYAVWTSVGEGHWNWAVDFDDDVPVITQARAETVSAGSYLVFRNGGAGSELVRTVADAEHGAAKHRPAQARWKAALVRATSAAGGYSPAADRLWELGALTVNLEHWTSERSIRPQRKADFAVACRFAGLEDECDELWEHLSAITRAHVRAGQTIRKRLEQALLDDGSGEQLIRRGYQSLELPGLGTMSAYRVLHKHPDHELVDADTIDKPYLAEARGWQG